MRTAIKNAHTLDTLSEIRDADGTLPRFAWPGGYPILYLAQDNGVLCPKCANEYKAERDNEDQLRPIAYFIHWEGPPEQCEHCNTAVGSAYGDPDALDFE